MSRPRLSESCPGVNVDDAQLCAVRSYVHAGLMPPETSGSIKPRSKPGVVLCNDASANGEQLNSVSPHKGPLQSSAPHLSIFERLGRVCQVPERDFRFIDSRLKQQSGGISLQGCERVGVRKSKRCLSNGQMRVIGRDLRHEILQSRQRP